jgi:hypothetical protein
MKSNSEGRKFKGRRHADPLFAEPSAYFRSDFPSMQERRHRNVMQKDFDNDRCDEITAPEHQV